MSQDQQIVIQNLSYKTPAGSQLFSKLNLTLAQVKTGLIGRNGIGKSTLFKLITNELPLTEGSIKTLGRVGYCPQDFSPYYNLTIAQFFEADEKLQALERISQGSIDPNDFTILADDWNIKECIIKYAEKFSFKIKDLFIKIGTLSNGEITRLWLAKIFNFKLQTDFLILDEPTNNLDINARAMLYNAICSWPKGILIISHDRQLLEFMDQILVLTEHGAKIYGGNFNFYKEQQQIEHAAKQKQFADAQKQFKKTNRLIQATHEKHERNQARGRRARQKNDQPKIMLNAAKNRSEHTQQLLNNQAVRLTKEAEQNLQKAKENLDADYIIQVALPKTFVPNDKIVATLENICFRYSSNHPFLFHNFNLTIRGPERIAICGANGSGKTTILKIIQKILSPETGAIEVRVNTYYLDQRLEILDPRLSILENYKKLNPNAIENGARMHLASFLFRNEKVLSKVETLSCGEKIRAALACVLLGENPPELLMLDEPTNHLDLENLECLESILKNYEGTLIIVSHDQSFLEKLAVDRVIRL